MRGHKYVRKTLFQALLGNLRGEPNLIQVVIGPRQVGKTTLVLQLLKKWDKLKIYYSADTPDVPTRGWIADCWQKARLLTEGSRKEALLVFDEIQKIPRWSSMVKRLFDEDKRQGMSLRIILLGSSALLMQKGLTESLAGRFEIHRHPHWTFTECQRFFNLSLNDYFCFGGYPGALLLRQDWARWAAYIRDSLIETVLSKDILLMVPVAKPALLRQVFALAVAHPAEILSYQKMLGQLQDAGNTTTIASYLNLLAKAFLVAPLERFSGSKIKQKGSIPKLLALDNALISAMSGKTLSQIKKDKISWGRLVENAVGAKLYALLQGKGHNLYYWRERQEEVDYVFEFAGRLIALEVKSSPAKSADHLLAFAKRYPRAELVLIAPVKGKTKPGVKQISLRDFFVSPQLVFASKK